MFPAARTQACWACLSAAVTLALLVVILSQACSAVERALEFWIFLVAVRHFCLAAATPLWTAEVDVVELEELLEPQALRAVAARMSTISSSQRGEVMSASSRMAATNRGSGVAGPERW